MNNDKAKPAETSMTPTNYAAAAHPRRPWWKRYRRTWIIFLVAIGSIAFFAAFSFGGRDSSGDAAGQGLASAFEALFFIFGVFVIGGLALIIWLSRYVRIPTIVMGIFGLVALSALVLIW
jgi:magnesium-transporting ATPase (P-type)